MGLAADHLTSKVGTGLIQRQQSKDKIARNTVVFKSSKRKASTAMRSPSPAKSPKLADHFEFFAMPGETQEDFSQSHFDCEGTTQLRHLCPRCLQWLCYYSHNYPQDRKVWCPKCEQFSSAYKRGIQFPERDRTSQPDASRSPDLAKGRLDDRTNLFKTLNMIVAFLCSLTRNENIYDKIIELEKCPLTMGTIHSAHGMLVDIGQAVGSGRIRGPRGAKDKEVVTVLRRIRGSLKKLQESYGSGARNQGPARILANPVSAGDPRPMKFQHPNSVIARLCRFMENATIFTQLREWGRSQVTDAVYRRVKLMHEYVWQVVQYG